MKVAFRVDASLSMGSGHVMRCLSLADGLAKTGAECVFLCLEHPGNLIGEIQSRGYKVFNLGPVLAIKNNSATSMGFSEWLGIDCALDAKKTIAYLDGQNIELLVVDNYGLDVRWEKIVRPFARRLMAIDDFASREHFVDILLDQNFKKKNLTI